MLLEIIIRIFVRTYYNGRMIAVWLLDFLFDIFQCYASQSAKVYQFCPRFPFVEYLSIDIDCSVIRTHFRHFRIILILSEHSAKTAQIFHCVYNFIFLYSVLWCSPNGDRKRFPFPECVKQQQQNSRHIDAVVP